MTGYLLDNVASEAGGPFARLEACYDQSTFGYLSALGLGEGGGAGRSARKVARSSAGWRCKWASPARVLGTDLNLDWVDAGMPRQVELRRHDVTSDQTPTSAYDLIKARLVLLDRLSTPRRTCEARP
jgi:hypothetical protein